MIVLVFESGSRRGERLRASGGVIRIGGRGCEASLPDADVSDPHCELEELDGELFLTDLGSARGTRVGARDAAPAPPRRRVRVPQGARIWLGAVCIAPSVEAGEETRPLAIPSSDTAPLRLAEKREDTEPASRASLPPSVFVAAPKPRSDARVLDGLRDDPDPEAALAPYVDRARLVFAAGPHAGRLVILGESPVELGRADVNVVVLSDPQAELRHATLSRRGGLYWIAPAGDRTVVRVNGERVLGPRALANGDVIGLGASETTFLATGLELSGPDAAATIVEQDSLFAFAGQVRRQRSLTIGSSPNADLFLDHLSVEREHACVVHRYPDFHLEDLSSSGCVLNGRRAAEHKLADGDELVIGAFTIRFEIQPLRCGLDVRPPDDDGRIPRFAPDVDAAAAYRTLYHLPSDLRAPAERREAQRKKDRAAVQWVEPLEVRRTWRTPLMVLVATLTSASVAFALASSGGTSFLRRPLSEAHRSAAFTERLEGRDACVACHGSFAARVTDSCTACHPREAHPLRAAHARVQSCTDCHFEHEGAAVGPKLIDGASCASGECHPTRHAAFFPQTPGPAVATPSTARARARRASFGVDLLADLELERGKRKTRIHQVHAQVEKKCGACHASDGAERPEGAAWQSCFSCHGPRGAEEALGALACSECHREHGPRAAWAERPAAPMALSALGSGAAALGLVGLPIALVLLMQGVTTRRRRFLAADDGAPTPEAAEELRCEGTTLAEATELPRLNPSRCVGSGDCVEICPYQVLEMAPGAPPRPVVARPELCHECGSCVAACGPKALTMMRPGEPFPLVDRPAVDANYETSIPGARGGVYVIGAAAAKPSVKNGINLGHWAVQHAAFEGAHPGAASKLGLEHELVIVGSGPAGLSAALSAREHGLDAVVLEQAASFGGAPRSYPKGKPVQVNPPPPERPEAPRPGEVGLSGKLWLAPDASREVLLARWEPIARALDIRYGERVIGLTAERGGFSVRTDKGEHRALKVILAIGDRGAPRRLEVPGGERALYGLDDPALFRGRHAVVVGGGDSAVEAAIALSEVAASVQLVHRGKALTRPTRRNLERLEGLRKANKLQLHLGRSVARVEARAIVLDGAPGELPCDALFALLGWEPPTELLRQLGVETTKKSADWDPGPSDRPAFLELGGPPR